MHQHSLQLSDLLLVYSCLILRTETIAIVFLTKNRDELIAYISSQQKPLIVDLPFYLFILQAFLHLLL